MIEVFVLPLLVFLFVRLLHTPEIHSPDLPADCLGKFGHKFDNPW